MRALYPLISGLAALALTVQSAAGKRPELDAVLWGNLTHAGGTPLRPAFLGEITVSAWLDGVKIAELAVAPSASPNPSRYLLKVPMDDGAEPRIKGTARSGERIRIRVKNVPLNLEHEIVETKSAAGFSLPQIKGAITIQNISLTEDLGGASPLMAQFAVWRAAINFQPDILDPHSDPDDDGMSNYAEFLANTDPESGASVLRIQQIIRSSGVNSLRIGPVKSGRRYSLLSSKTLLPDDWTIVVQFTATADEESRWQDHVSSDTQLFYRIEPHVQ